MSLSAHAVSVVADVSTVLYGVLMVVIVLGNALVLVLVGRSGRRAPRYSSLGGGGGGAIPAPHRALVLHLTCADLAVGLALPFLLVVMTHPEVAMASLASCQALTAAFTLPLNQSLLAFLAMLVYHHHRQRGGGGEKAASDATALVFITALLAITWVYSGVHALASALLITWSDGAGCVYESEGNRAYLTANSSLIIVYLAVAAVGTVVYRRRGAAGGAESGAEVSIPATAFLVVNILTWVPNCVFTIATTNYFPAADAAHDYILLVTMVRMALNALIYANSALKPLIYVYHNRRHLLASRTAPAPTQIHPTTL